MHSEMPSLLAPVANLVILSFDNGDIQLTSVIDSETKQHLVTCDLIKLGIRGSITCIFQHRNGDALYHLISEHSSGSTPPGQLLVQIFITKEDENALDISEYITADWRRQNNIPDSVNVGVELGQTRKRSDTVSTVHSDSHDQKRNKLEEIQE